MTPLRSFRHEYVKKILLSGVKKEKKMEVKQSEITRVRKQGKGATE